MISAGTSTLRLRAGERKDSGAGANQRFPKVTRWTILTETTNEAKSNAAMKFHALLSERYTLAADLMADAR